MIRLRNSFAKVIGYFNYAGIAVCFGIMVLTTLDVVLRKVSPLNIRGSYELIEMGMVILTFLGIAELQVKDGHVKVDMLTMHLSWRFQKILMFFILLAEVAVYGVMTYAGTLKYIEFQTTPVHTGVLELPYDAFYIIMIAGLACFTILLMMDAVIQMADGILNRKPAPQESIGNKDILE
jgi:TRAP-type C4-dicarboxylate transport system permease small subunit